MQSAWLPLDRATTSLGRVSFPWSYWLVLDILLDRANTARPIELGSARSSGWSSHSQYASFFVALIKQLSSTVPNLKPPKSDTSLFTLPKVKDKACSIICLKLMSSLRLLALALTIGPRYILPLLRVKLFNMISSEFQSDCILIIYIKWTI